ncbi:U3 small nucleolar RNA-associated protein 6 homolog [Nilaparvata lugens]|uniref:U3 small nucleolar RNA-associated protein 6 homolog n=1 Tax=Nilaparvata lugens TaxID=108931 RepID=UPI000B99508D|nr:U3 small nucleolar RNA-associated protein 6 homolog [Nilaparvata lugens]
MAMAESKNQGEDLLDELELMEKLELFTKSEIKTIKKKREEFETKLARHSSNKEDVLQYIESEVAILKTVRSRKLEKELPSNKSTIEYAIANRVKNLFNDAIRRYSDDVKIWISYVNFCKQIGLHSSGSEVFQQMLKYHGDKAGVYVLAANWELEECKNIEKARNHLQTGLHIHNDCDKLYIHLFRLELKSISIKVNEELKSEDKSTPNPDESIYAPLDAIYDIAVRKINNVQIMVQLLERAKPYEFTANLQNKIVADMQEKFPKEEVTWDTVAKMALYNTNNKEKSSAKERLSNCVSEYKTALKNVNTEKMWSMYLATLIKVLNDNVQFPFPNYKRKLNFQAFSDADEANNLSEKYYLLWIEQLRKDMPSFEPLKKSQVDDTKKQTSGSQDDSTPEELDEFPPQENSGDKSTSSKSTTWDTLRQVLEKATEKHSSSIALWDKRLSLNMTWGDDSAVEAIFEQANTCLQENSLPLWKLMLPYWQLSDPDKVDKLLERGSNQIDQPNLCNPLRVIRLEWVALTEGLAAARKLYFEIVQKPPTSMQLHQKMIALDTIQPRKSIENIRMYYIFPCVEFGADNIDVWMNYFKFEKKHGNYSNIADIYGQACSKLNDSLIEEFKNEYNVELKKP